MKKPILIVVLLLICVNVGVFFGYLFNGKTGRVATPPPPSDREVACGALCLRLAANLYGIPCEEYQALSHCPPNSDGTRLGDLQKAAIKFGLKANMAKLSWQKLRLLQELVILHVNDNHYVLANLNELNGDRIRIYDYDLGTRWYDQKSLEAIWKGTSLVLAKDLDFQVPLPLLVPTYWIDKGDFTANENAEYFFNIKNVSTKPVELDIIFTSCQCSSAALLQETLEPGEETVLIVFVKLEGKRGGFRERVILQSTDGDEKKTNSFILAGTVIRHDILSAERIFAGTTHRGGTITETFAIRDPGNGLLQRVEAALQEPVSWLNSKITREKVTQENLKKIRTLNVKPGDWIVTLSAEIKKEAVLQQFKLPIVVKTNLASPLDTFVLSFEGEIVPVIRVEPAALIFSDQSRRQPKTIIAKSLVSSLQLPEPQIHLKDNVLLLSKTERINGQELSIEIRVNVDDALPLGLFVGNIELDFGDEGTINVPVIYQTPTEMTE